VFIPEQSRPRIHRRGSPGVTGHHPVAAAEVPHSSAPGLTTTVYLTGFGHSAPEFSDDKEVRDAVVRGGPGVRWYRRPGLADRDGDIQAVASLVRHLRPDVEL
jgi:hypothetical protein